MRYFLVARIFSIYFFIVSIGMDGRCPMEFSMCILTFFVEIFLWRILLRRNARPYMQILVSSWVSCKYSFGYFFCSLTKVSCQKIVQTAALVLVVGGQKISFLDHDLLPVETFFSAPRGKNNARYGNQNELLLINFHRWVLEVHVKQNLKLIHNHPLASRPTPTAFSWKSLSWV